jgi:hypothetical protein
LGIRNDLTTRGLPDATGLSGDPLIDANIRPILAASVFSKNTIRTRRNPRIKPGGAIP